MDLFDLFCKISIDLSEFESGIEKAKAKASTLAKDLGSVSSNISGAYSGVKDVLQPAVDGFKAVEGVGKTAGKAVTTGLKGFAAAATTVAGFGTAAVKSGMAFDSTMSQVSAISGKVSNEDLPDIVKAAQDMGLAFEDTGDATSTAMSILRNKALEMGATTKFSASEAGEAMTYMAMAGWKAGDMINGIGGVMDLAAASGEDLATTSDIVTDALTAFGRSASDSGHLADIMAAASSNANTNVSMLGESFKYVAPVAGALGYTMEDTSLALGLMANSGIKASQAGTSLRTALTNMTKPTKAMAAVMDTYGISLTDSSGKMYTLGELMVQLRTKMGGLDEATQASATAALFGKEAMSGMLAIINAAPEDFDKLTTAINECNGAAKDMAATMIDNLQGDLTLLGSAFESLQIAISDSLTPTLREFAQFGQKAMANLLEGFQSGDKFGFFNALEDVVAEGVSMLSAKAVDFVWVSTNFVLSFVSGILDSKNQILEAGRDVIDFLINVFGEYIRISAPEMAEFGTDIVKLIFDGFSQAGEIISDVIGDFIPLIAQAFLSYHESLFTVGIDILGAIGQGIVENKDQIQEMASSTITNMVTALRENAPMIIEGGLALLEALVGAIEENMPLILATGAEIIGQLVAGIATASPEVQAIIGVAVLPHILKIVDTVGKIGGAVTSVVKVVGDGINTVMGIGSKLMGGISSLFSLIAANPVVAIIGLIIGAVVLLYSKCEWFRDGVHAVIDGVVGFFQTAYDAVKAAWEGAGEFFGGVVDGIRGVFDGIGEFLGGLFSDAWEAVKNAWNATKEFFSGVVDGIKGAFDGVKDFLGSLFSDAWDAVKGAWEGAKEFFGDLWSNIKEKASDAAENVKGKLKDAWDGIKSAWDTAKTFFGDLWSNIKEKGGEAADKVKTAFEKGWDGIKSAWDGAMSFFGDVWQGIRDVFSDAWDKFKDIGGNIVKGIWDGISGAAGWLWDQVSGFFGGFVDGVKDFFGIHSPSTVFAEIGENMIQGLGKGVDDESGSVDNQLEAMSKEMIAAFSTLADSYNAIGKSALKAMADAFSTAPQMFTEIGQNAISGLSNGLGATISNLQSKVAGLMNSITNAAKAALGIHSPSKVFAGIGENMALGLGEGWNDEYDSIKRKITSGLDFGTASVGLAVSGTGCSTPRTAQNGPQAGFGGTGNTYVTINSPVTVDAVQAAREWKKTTQRMAMSYV